MKLFVNFLLFTILFSCTNVTSQTNLNNKCSDCTLYLEPIIGENFIIGEDEKIIKEKFSTFEKVQRDNLGNLPDSGIEYFKVNKNIILPNNIKSILKIEFGFKNGKLIKFNFLIDLGENGNNNFKELIGILKKNDPKKINLFLYETNDFFFYEFKNNCRKIFSLTRNPDNYKTFNLDVKLSYEGRLE